MQDHHNASILGLQHTCAHGMHPNPGPERLACCLMAACASQQKSPGCRVLRPLASLTFWAQGRSGSISNQAMRRCFYTSHQSVSQAVRWGFYTSIPSSSSSSAAIPSRCRLSSSEASVSSSVSKGSRVRFTPRCLETARAYWML